MGGLFALLMPGLVMAQTAGGSADNPVPPLMRNLNSDYVRVAASAARSLGVIFSPGGRGGDELGEATTALIGTLASTKGAVLRRESAIALGKMKARTALDPLKEAIKDVDYSVAIAAANAIREILPVDEARAYLKEIAKDETESVQVAAYDAMSQIGKSDDADFFITGMDSPNWRIATSAIRGLERSVRAGARI
ncbi:MAG: HEAT repeat domain-containing protein, partial [Verrucomicrobiota bacterium]